MGKLMSKCVDCLTYKRTRLIFFFTWHSGNLTVSSPIKEK